MTKDELLAEGFSEIESMATGDTWDFDANPTARGVFMGKQENVGPNGSNLYHFIDEQGDAYAIWGSSILDDRFSSLQVGETVVVMYEGKQKSQSSNREYKTYSVLHRMIPGALERVKSAGGTGETPDARKESPPF